MIPDFNRRHFLMATLLGGVVGLNPTFLKAQQSQIISIGYNIPEEAEIAYPYRASWASPANLVGLALEPLVRLGGENSIEFVLAESIEGDVTGINWIIKIHSDAKWDNGESLNVSQVVENIVFWMRDEKSLLGKQLKSYISDIQVNPNSRDIQVTLNRPHYHFQNIFTSYTALIMHPQDKWKFGVHSRSTGPFRMTSYRAAEEVFFEPLPQYWNQSAKAYFPVRMMQDTGRLESAFDFIPNMDPDRGVALQSRGVDVKHNLLADALVFHMDCTDENLKDSRVRRALRLSLDPKAMIDSVFGYGTPSDHTHASPIHHDYPNDWNSRRVYDLEIARQLLSKTNLVLPLHYNRDLVWQKHAIDSYLKSAAQVGVTIVPFPHESSEFDKNWGTYPGLTSTKWIHRPLAMQLYKELYHSEADWNLSKWSNKEFDSLVDSLISTSMTDIMSIRTKTKRAMQILQDDGPMIQAAWLNCSKAYVPERLIASSVQVGSGGHIYANRLRLT